jgi:hypothetical protein
MENIYYFYYFYYLNKYKGHISPLGSTIPAIFAKSSMVWSTALFFYSNKPIREAFVNKKWSSDDEVIGKDKIELKG